MVIARYSHEFQDLPDAPLFQFPPCRYAHLPSHHLNHPSARLIGSSLRVIGKDS